MRGGDENINVTQEHDAVISRCTERMYEKNLPAETIKKTAHTPYAERGDQSGISEGIE